jgi:hypothetical protein
MIFLPELSLWNARELIDTVATPVLFPPAGIYHIWVSPILVTITCTTPGASIWYTTDGSDPLLYGILYDPAHGIDILATTNLRVVATVLGMTPSTVVNALYIISAHPWATIVGTSTCHGRSGPTNFTIAGTSTVSIDIRALSKGTTNIVGTSTSAFTGISKAKGTTAIAGTSTVGFGAAAKATGNYTIPGIATTSFIGLSEGMGVFSSSSDEEIIRVINTTPFYLQNQLSYSTNIAISDKNKTLIVGMASENTGAGGVLTSIKFNGVNMTLIDTEVSDFGGANPVYSYLYYLDKAHLPPIGTYALTMTFGVGGFNKIYGAALCLENTYRQFSAIASTIYSGVYKNNINTNITTLTDNAWVVDILATSNNGTGTVGAGQIKQADGGTPPATPTMRGLMSTKLVAAHGPTNLSWTLSNSSQYMVQILASFPPFKAVEMIGLSEAIGATHIAGVAGVNWYGFIISISTFAASGTALVSGVGKSIAKGVTHIAGVASTGFVAAHAEAIGVTHIAGTATVTGVGVAAESGTFNSGRGGSIIYGNTKSVAWLMPSDNNYINHVLDWNGNNKRVVLIGIIGEPNYVTYNGVSMHELTYAVQDSHKYVNIYYILDSELPATSGTYVINVNLTNWVTNPMVSISSFKNIMQYAGAYWGGMAHGPIIPGGANWGAIWLPPVDKQGEVHRHNDEGNRPIYNSFFYDFVYFTGKNAALDPASPQILLTKVIPYLANGMASSYKDCKTEGDDGHLYMTWNIAMVDSSGWLGALMMPDAISVVYGIGKSVAKGITHIAGTTVVAGVGKSAVKGTTHIVGTAVVAGVGKAKRIGTTHIAGTASTGFAATHAEAKGATHIAGTSSVSIIPVGCFTINGSSDIFIQKIAMTQVESSNPDNLDDGTTWIYWDDTGIIGGGYGYTQINSDASIVGTSDSSIIANASEAIGVTHIIGTANGSIIGKSRSITTIHIAGTSTADFTGEDVETVIFAIDGYSANSIIAMAEAESGFILDGYASDSIIGKAEAIGDGSIDGYASDSIIGLAEAESVFVSDGYASDSIVGLAEASGDGSSDGYSSSDFIGEDVETVIFAIDGYASDSIIGLAKASGTGSTDGYSSDSIIGLAEATADGSSDGYATIDYIGLAEAESGFASDGYASDSIIGLAEASGDSSSDGYATIDFVGETIETVIFSIDGYASDSIIGLAEATSDFSSDGYASDSIIGLAEASGDGSADGYSSSDFIGEDVETVIFAIDGYASDSIVGLAEASGDGSADGYATIDYIGLAEAESGFASDGYADGSIVAANAEAIGVGAISGTSDGSIIGNSRAIGTGAMVGTSTISGIGTVYPTIETIVEASDAGNTGTSTTWTTWKDEGGIGGTYG